MTSHRVSAIPTRSSEHDRAVEQTPEVASELDTQSQGHDDIGEQAIPLMELSAEQAAFRKNSQIESQVQSLTATSEENLDRDHPGYESRPCN